MIRLKRARLRHYCQHADLDVTFSPHLTAIVGPNGSGKSNLLAALEGALTGVFGGSPGGKLGNVRMTSDDKDRSSVSLTVSLADGSEAEIARSLRPAGQKLVVGGQSYTRESEMSDRVGGWLGMQPRVFGSFAFARQWQIFSVVDASPSDRAKSMARLFRLDHAEECWHAIGEHLRTLEDTKLPFDETAVRERLRTDREALDALRIGLALLEVPAPEEDERARQALARLTLRGRLEAECQQKRAELSAVDARLAELATTQSVVTADLDALRAGYEPTSVAQAEEDLNIWKRRRSALAQLDAGRAVLERHLSTEHQQALPADVPPWTEEDADEADRLRGEQQQLQRFVQTFDPSTGQAECPTCGTPVCELADRLEHGRARLAEVSALVREFVVRRQVVAAYQKQRAAYDSWRSAWVARRDTLMKQLEAVEAAAPAAPDRTETELSGFLAAQQEIGKIISGLVDEAKELQSQQRFDAARREQLAARVAQLDAEIADIPSCGEEAEALRARIEKNRRLESERLRHAAQIERLELAVSDAERSLASLVGLQLRSDRVRRWRGVLERVRDALHRDRLPSLVAQSYLEQLEASVNRYLDDLGVDFRVRVDSGLSFAAIFPDGRDVPAERLSGGEKVVFALAWRLAVNAAFAADVGILCLDEPTAGLDADRLGCLRRALTRLRDLSGRSGLQCVIVTHERSLMPLFDHVIELQPTS